MSRQFSSSARYWGETVCAAEDVQEREISEPEAKDDVENANVINGHREAIVDFDLDEFDNILAESREQDVYAIPELETGAEEDTPQSFIEDAFEKQRAQRERKRKQSMQRSLNRKESDEPNDFTGSIPLQIATRPRTDEFPPHSTFPRLPRISREPLPQTPLKSRTQQQQLTPAPKSKDYIPPRREQWQIEKAAIKAKYPNGYQPSKRLSPDAVTGIRALHAQMPGEYHTRKLAEEFQVSPEAISRILRTKWTPSAEEEADRARRWLKRGESVWTRYAEMGVKPPKRWREAGIGKDSEVFKMESEKRKQRRKLKGLGNESPILVTLPARKGGLYNRNGGNRKRSRGDDGAGFI